MSSASILGPDGVIARQLSGYEPRSQQLQMADAVAEAIAERRHLMVEAGTGVGKSFAYLVPAILAATANKECRVVISTHTISLQEQLVHKDIPFLQSVMPQQFNATLVKGRSNYLSLRRLRGAQQRAGSAAGRAGRGRAVATDWPLVADDAGRQPKRSGLSATACPLGSGRERQRQLPRPRLSRLRQVLLFPGTQADVRRQPAHRQSRPVFQRSRPAAQGANLLPDYKVVVFDEAHTLEDVAADHLGLQISAAPSSIC